MIRLSRLLPSAIVLASFMVQAIAATTDCVDGHRQGRWILGTRSFEVCGSIEFTDDDRDVKSVSQGGYIRIDEGGWLGSGRSYEVRPDPNGSLLRTYRVGGRVQAIDSGTQAWVAGAILTLIRESGINADQRVERLLTKGGPESVLREISEIGSDSSKSSYLRELVKRGRLSDDQSRDVMRSVRRIGSDGEKTALLVEVSSRFLKPGLRESWFTTLSTVGSDGEKSRGLKHAIVTDPGAETLILAVRLCGSVGSDGDKSSVLSEIAARGIPPPVRRSWFRAVEKIGSDGDKRQVLSAALSAHDAKAALVEILRAAATIGSDGDKASVLADAARSDIDADLVQQAFFSAVNTIGSDGDRSVVLNRVLRRPNQPVEVVLKAIDSASRIGSDGDKASLLLFAAERYGSNASVHAALERSLKSIHSDGDYRRVSTALLR